MTDAVRGAVRRLTSAVPLQWVAEDAAGVTLRYPAERGGIWYRFEWCDGDTPRDVHRRLYAALEKPIARPADADALMTAHYATRPAIALEEFFRA